MRENQENSAILLVLSLTGIIRVLFPRVYPLPQSQVQPIDHAVHQNVSNRVLLWLDRALVLTQELHR